MFFAEARHSLHGALLRSVLPSKEASVPTNADNSNAASVAIARGLLQRLETAGTGSGGQILNDEFAVVCKDFLDRALSEVAHLSLGEWEVKYVGGSNRMEFANHEQYRHLAALKRSASKNSDLAATLKSDYTITPDIIVLRELDEDGNFADPKLGKYGSENANLRHPNRDAVLRAGISCKWTLKSDQGQHSPSEALNLMRVSEGQGPDVVVVTGEPLPSRIAPIALGTADIDCVYHVALDELMDTLSEGAYPDAKELLSIMVDSKRLKDIGDLPLDLTV